MPFDDFALLEAAHSRGRARSGCLKSTAKSHLEKVLGPYVKQISTAVRDYMGQGVDPVLATNLNPYAEGVYFLIWQSLLARAKVTVEMEEHDWSSVVPSLISGKLSFAIWNDFVPAPYDKADKGSIFRSVHPLFKYNGYPLVVRRDALEKLLEKQIPRAESRLIVKALIAGQPIDDVEFSNCSVLKSELRKMSLGLVGNTEIQDVADRALGRIPYCVPITSDEAVGQLVDGTLDGAFVGGIQAAYLAKRFSASTVTLTKVDRPTPVHIWFKGETYDSRQYPKTVQPLLCAWRMTCLVWDEARKQARAGRSSEHALLREWILSLASQLNYGVGGDERGMRTPISSWRMLADLAREHNELQQPSEVRLHKELSPEERRENPAGREIVELPLSNAGAAVPTDPYAFN